MKKTKNLVIATVLLVVGTISNQENETKDIIIGAITPETSPEMSQENVQDNIEEQITTESLLRSTSSEGQATSATPEQEAIKTWNAHLESLKELGQHWNKNSNIPTDSWKEEAITLAKEALNQDKTIAEALKSAFFNTITEKIKIEEDEFSASTYALIKEFDDTIDAYVTTLKDAETPKEAEKEEAKPEPVAETVPAPIEVEGAPALSDEALAKSEPAAAPITQKTILEEWNDLLQQIATTGSNNTLNESMVIKTYELAKDLLFQNYTQESLFSGFESALIQHNANRTLFPININQAIEAFSAETGITIPYNQQIPTQQEYTAAMKKQAEQQEIAKKQKEAELKTAATVQEAIKQANISESQMLQLNKKLEEKLALERAMREAEQAKMNAELERMKRELASAHKPKAKEAPEEQGLISRAIGAVKGAASAATTWWYGGESQEEKDIKALDEKRFENLQTILKTMTVTPNERLAIEQSWTTFITHLRTFKNLDTNNVKEIAAWLNTVQQSLEFLIFRHNIIPSIKDAITIMKNAIEQYPDGDKFINSIESRLTRKQTEIIAAKQQKENAQTKKIQAREEHKQTLELKKQRIKEEEKCIKAAKSRIEAYECEKASWQQLLIDIAQHKDVTEEDNSIHTNDAIKKAELLLNPVHPVVLENKLALEQDLKKQFINALLAQQGKEHKINIYKNIDQFNAAIDKITR